MRTAVIKRSRSHTCTRTHAQTHARTHAHYIPLHVTPSPCLYPDRQTDRQTDECLFLCVSTRTCIYSFVTVTRTSCSTVLMTLAVVTYSRCRSIHWCDTWTGKWLDFVGRETKGSLGTDLLPYPQLLVLIYAGEQTIVTQYLSLSLSLSLPIYLST